jgi:Protein of unknown function (DUF2829)
VDFSDALRAMKDGKKVTRAVWVGYAMIMDMPAPLEPQIVMGYAGKEVLRPFAGSQWDLLSDDWEIV